MLRLFELRTEQTPKNADIFRDLPLTKKRNVITFYGLKIGPSGTLRVQTQEWGTQKYAQDNSCGF